MKSPFRTLLRAEAQNAVRRSHLIALAVLALVGPLNALLLPRFPESVYRFFIRAFKLDDWLQIVLVNDYTALAMLFWVGVFDVLRAYVVPLEEGQLDLLLSKPLSRSAYLLARLIPALTVATVMGVLMAAVHGISAQIVLGGLDVPSFVGASAILIGWNVALLALVSLLFLSTRESYYALAVAFVPWFLSFAPGMAFLYRPDLFEAAGGQLDRLIAPLNLIWHHAFVARWGGAIAIALFILATAIVALAGRRLERRDVA